jgi:hypothetical protein
MKQLNVRRTITFRQVMITVAILLLANLCATIFIGSTPSVPVPQAPTSFYGPSLADYPMDSEMRTIAKDFQIEVCWNGDFIIYEDGLVPLGVVKRNGKCDFKSIINQHMIDND